MLNLCIACHGETTNGDRYAGFPYCEGCYYSGRAYENIWADTVNEVEAAGFPCTVFQTGGGCQSLAVALTEAGWNGPHVLLGLLGRTVDTTEYGVSVQAHGHDWVGEHDGCAACAALYATEQQMNAEVPEQMTADEYTAWIITTARTLAKAVNVSHKMEEN